MKNKSHDFKKIVAKAKENSPGKRNYTFRLREDLMDQFEKVCDREKVTRTAVLEEFLKEFTKYKG